MTNKEAIELLDNLKGMIEDNQGNDYDEALKMGIEALERRWIPVSERPPERWQLVNITIKDYDESLLTGVGYYRGNDDGTWFITAGDGEFLAEDEVIAWMPLPEAYKAESEVHDADCN